MRKIASIILICISFWYPASAWSLEDQGLASIMDIIDRAIEQFAQNKASDQLGEEEKKKADEAASSTVVNLSRTLGKLSYSRLQCGEAEVLAEFTLRVQKLPPQFQDSMRDAFQEGFDASKSGSALLSEDECKRLTQSRKRSEAQADANVKEDPNATKDKSGEDESRVEEEPPEVEDPRLKHLRIAELSGQLAWRRRFCGDDKVHSRDFKEVINRMPSEFQAEAKDAYWKGYRHGKQINKGFKKEKCG